MRVYDVPDRGTGMMVMVGTCDDVPQVRRHGDTFAVRERITAPPVFDPNARFEPTQPITAHRYTVRLLRDVDPSYTFLAVVLDPGQDPRHLPGWRPLNPLRGCWEGGRR